MRSARGAQHRKGCASSRVYTTAATRHRHLRRTRPRLSVNNVQKTSTKGGSVEDLSLQKASNVFTASASIVAASGLLRTAAAELCANNIFNIESSVPDLVRFTQIRNDASFIPILLAALISLKQASDKGNLTTSSTYERLNYLCIGYCICSVLVSALTDGGNTSVLLVRLLEAVPVIGSCVYALSLSDTGGVRKCAQTITQDLRASFFDVKRESLLSKYYIAQLWITFVVGASFLLSPTSPVANPAELGGETQILASLRHVFGGNALFALCPAVFVLDSAAQRNRLGASTFRNLNIGCGLATFLVTAYTFYVVLEAPSIVNGGEVNINDYSLLPNLVSALLISSAQAGVYLYQGLKPDDK